MKILIIEDERPAAQRLVRLLKEAEPDALILDILGSVEESVNWLMQNPAPDLIFVDIQLEDGISFEIFEKHPVQTPVIFTTAYDEYALRAFKLNSVDYLLKPVSEEELTKALAKYKMVHTQSPDSTRWEKVLSQIMPPTKERFLIRIGEKYRSVPVSEIICFYLSERCTFALTGAGKSYPLDYSLEKIEHIVDPGTFFRVNRNYIINIHAIKDVLIYSANRLKITLTQMPLEEDILVSRERVADFKEWMDR